MLKWALRNSLPNMVSLTRWAQQTLQISWRHGGRAKVGRSSPCRLGPPASQNFAALSFVRVPDAGGKGRERDTYRGTNVCQVVFTCGRGRFVLCLQKTDKITPLCVASQRLGWAGLEGWPKSPVTEASAHLHFSCAQWSDSGSTSSVNS